MRTAILTRSLGTIARQLADGSLRARDVVEAALAPHDPALNGYVTWVQLAALVLNQYKSDSFDPVDMAPFLCSCALVNCAPARREPSSMKLRVQV